MATKRTAKRSTKTTKSGKTKGKTRTKEASEKPKRQITLTYQLTKEELFELKARNLELEKLNNQVNKLVQQKIQKQLEIARAEARDEVEGWHKANENLVDVQKRLQKKYGKRGYTLQDPDGETGEGKLLRTS